MQFFYCLIWRKTKKLKISLISGTGTQPYRISDRAILYPAGYKKGRIIRPDIRPVGYLVHPLPVMIVIFWQVPESVNKYQCCRSRILDPVLFNPLDLVLIFSGYRIPDSKTRIPKTCKKFSPKNFISDPGSKNYRIPHTIGLVSDIDETAALKCKRPWQT
jgi:hypothetical protein